jgi:hypothetical protein
MAKYKPFSPRTKIPELLVRAEVAAARWKANPITNGPLPPGVPTGDLVTGQIEKLRGSNQSALRKDQDWIRQREADKKALLDSLARMAKFYESIGVYDPAVTGFDLVLPRSSNNGAPPMPSMLALVHGKHPGVIIAKTSFCPYARTWELQITDGDPTVEANWGLAGMFFHSSDMEVTGKEGGKIYSFRVRASGPGGTSPWSPISTIRVL